MPRLGVFCNRWIAWSGVAAIAATIAVLSLVPQPEQIVPVHVWDKLSHVLAYGLLSATLNHALICSRREQRHRIPIAISLSTLYGVVLEVAQFFAPPRTCDVFDAVANCIGACIGAGAYSCFMALRGGE